MQRINAVGFWISLILAFGSFSLINYATSQGILFFAALAVTMAVVATTFYQTDRIEARIIALQGGSVASARFQPGPGQGKAKADSGVLRLVSLGAVVVILIVVVGDAIPNQTGGSLSSVPADSAFFTLLAAVLGSVATLAGSALISRYHNPHISVDFKTHNGVRPYFDTQTILGGSLGKQLRLVVSNTGRSPANNCEAKLTWEERGVEQPFQVIPPWLRRELGALPQDRFTPITVNTKDCEELILLQLDIGQTEIHTVSFKQANIQPNTPYLLNVTVFSGNADPAMLKFSINWDGTWDGFNSAVGGEVPSAAPVSNQRPATNITGVKNESHMENSEFVMTTISDFLSRLSPASWIQYIVSSFLALAALYLVIATPPQPSQPSIIQSIQILESDYTRLVVVFFLLAAMAISLIWISRVLNNKQRALFDIRTAVFFERKKFDSAEPEKVKKVLGLLERVYGSYSVRWRDYAKLTKEAKDIISESPPSSEVQAQPATAEQKASEGVH